MPSLKRALRLAAGALAALVYLWFAGVRNAGEARRRRAARRGERFRKRA